MPLAEKGSSSKTGKYVNCKTSLETEEAQTAAKSCPELPREDNRWNHKLSPPMQ
jgi:hypothetical protein